jgi:L-threonylcarbamoyladenylate synthase
MQNLKVIAINAAAPEPHLIQACADGLKAGGVAVYPTDTFYGIGGNALDRHVVERIYKIKQRRRGKPLILLISRLAAFFALTADRPPYAERLARACWPGPLTLVLPASRGLPAFARSAEKTVALRIPASPLMRQLIDACGFPLTGSSANLSGGASPASAADLDRRILGQVDLLIDGGDTGARQGSTLVDCSGGRPVILRPGGFPDARVYEAAGAE